jgi:hypothetical protein
VLGKRVGVGVLVAAATLAVSVPASASAAVTLGPDPLPARTGVITSSGARIFAHGFAPGATLDSPLDGVLTRWRVRRGSGGGVLNADTVTLRVLRPTGMLAEFTARGTSDAHAVPGGSSDPIDVYEFPTRLPVTTGDRIGLGTTAGSFTHLALPGASYIQRVGLLGDGATALFALGAFPDRLALFNADLEPDADGDGFGDETQDLCPTDASTQGPCPTAEPPADTELEGSASAKKKQKQKGKKIVVKAKAKAGEDLSAKGKGEIKVKKKTYKLKPVTKSVSSGSSKNLKLKPKKSKDRKKIAKALKKGKKAKAKLTVKLTDEAGNSETEKLLVKLTR